MLRSLRYWLARRRFARLVKSYDDRIKAARAKHAPVRHIVREKRAFVASCLAGKGGRLRVCL